MLTLTQPDALLSFRSNLPESASIGFVPTMGALHRGHAALIEAARKRADQLLVSIFVNPLQFGEGEDLERYPRTLSADLELCRSLGVDAVFAPTHFYGDAFKTEVRVKELTDRWEGAHRPGHLDGVTTVVAALFNVARPTFAVFGQKDYQQFRVIKKMSDDMFWGVEVVGHPTIREEDGVALSSRNGYLSSKARTRARCLSEGLFAAQAAFSGGERDAATLLEVAASPVREHADTVDYVALVHPDTLEPLEGTVERGRLVMAAHIDGTRLIDNLGLTSPA